MSRNWLDPSNEGQVTNKQCRIVHHQKNNDDNKKQPSDRLSKEIESVSAAGDAAVMIMAEVRNWTR